MTNLKTHGTLTPDKGTCDLCGYPLPACSAIQIGKARNRELVTLLDQARICISWHRQGQIGDAGARARAKIVADIEAALMRNE